MRYSQQQQGLPPWKKVWHLHLTNICMVGVFMLKRMYGGVLLASLIPCLAVAADNASVQLILSPATHSDNVNVVHDSFVAVVLDSPRRANFKHEKASSKVMSMADWVLTSGDHQHKPFLIVDKVHAKVLSLMLMDVCAVRPEHYSGWLMVTKPYQAVATAQSQQLGQRNALRQRGALSPH